MFKKTAVTAALIFTLMCCGRSLEAAAQQPEAENARQSRKAFERVPARFFGSHGDEDGKKINTRQYSMNLNSDNKATNLKSGTSRPGRIETGRGSSTLMWDKHWSRIEDAAEPSICRCAPRSANFANPEQTPRQDMASLLRR